MGKKLTKGWKKILIGIAIAGASLIASIIGKENPNAGKFLNTVIQTVAKNDSVFIQ